MAFTLFLEQLNKICPGIITKQNVPMKDYTTFRAGGNARMLVQPKNVSELKAVLALLDELKIKHILLGNGSNTLFRDGTYEGVVIKLFEDDSEFTEIKLLSDCEVRIGSACLMSVAAKKAFYENGLTGFEQLSGIPGSIGGALFMNAGAYEKDMSEVVMSAHVVSKDGKAQKELSLDELKLSYRHSALMETGDIVTSVTFKLEKGDKSEIEFKLNDYKNRRNAKQPLKYASAGSTFKRPKGHFAAKLIDDSGLKGKSVGKAQVSELHAGFLINLGGASATDILKLIDFVKKTVYEKYGVLLEEEVRII